MSLSSRTIATDGLISLSRLLFGSPPTRSCGESKRKGEGEEAEKERLEGPKTKYRGSTKG